MITMTVDLSKVRVGDKLTMDVIVYNFAKNQDGSIYRVDVKTCPEDESVTSVRVYGLSGCQFKKHIPAPPKKLQVNAPVGTVFHMPGSDVHFKVEAWVNGYCITTRSTGRSDPYIINPDVNGSFERYEVVND